jgi:hypothetical protein
MIFTFFFNSLYKKSERRGKSNYGSVVVHLIVTLGACLVYGSLHSDTMTSNDSVIRWFSCRMMLVSSARGGS